ncbi:MAG: TolC family protein [Candidatus Caenarcaniphilales bacterium]|nr:TolC family protein [Candidatus Caenarcaniphilales bacterium]
MNQSNQNSQFVLPINRLDNFLFLFSVGNRALSSNISTRNKSLSPKQAEIQFSKIKKTLLVGLTILLLLHGLQFRVQSTGVESSLILGIPEVLEYAEKKNLDVAIAQSQIEQTKGQYVASYADLMPSVRGQFSTEKFNGGEVFSSATPVDLDRTTLRPLVSMDYAIQTGGRAIYQVKASKNQFKRSHYAKTRILQTAYLDSLIAYYNWQRDIAAVNIARQALEESEQQAKLSADRYDDGFATKLEVSQNKTIKADRQASLIEAMNQEQISLSNLVALLNIPQEKKVLPLSPIIVPTNFYIVEALSVNDLMEIALRERPELKELSLLVKEAKNRYGMARAELFPTINFSSFIRGIGPDLSNLETSRQGMFNVNVDLMRNLGVGAFGNMKQSKAKIQEAILNKQKQFNEIYKEISKAHREVNLYQQKLRVAQSRINSAREAYTIAKFRSSEGLGINLEVIQAQTELTKAQLDYQTAASNYNGSQINLLQKIGELTPERILNALPASEEDRCFKNEICDSLERNMQIDITETAYFDDEKADPRISQNQMPTLLSASTNIEATSNYEQKNSLIESHQERNKKLENILISLSSNQEIKTESKENPAQDNEIKDNHVLDQGSHKLPAAVVPGKIEENLNEKKEAVEILETMVSQGDVQKDKVDFKLLAGFNKDKIRKSKNVVSQNPQQKLVLSGEFKQQPVLMRAWVRFKSFFRALF